MTVLIRGIRICRIVWIQVVGFLIRTIRKIRIQKAFFQFIPARPGWEINMHRLFILLGAFIVPSLFAQTGAFIGTFANDQITLTLLENNGQITGQVQLQGQSFPVTAQRAGNNAVQGAYQYFGQNFPFEATVQGNVMTLTSEGAVYTLHKRQSAAGPLGAGTPPSSTTPQNPNEIVDKEFGVRFTPPKGWIAQKNEAGYLLGSHTEKGVIVMTGNEYSSLEQMRAEARQGLVDENGTNLQLAGEIVAIGEKMLGAPYQGMVEWQPAKAYAVGLLSPLGGGVSIIAMVETVSYSEKYADYVKAIAKSMQFFKPETPPIAEQWKRDLSGVKLTYLWSYYSGGSSDGSYAGGSQKTEIHLCPQGLLKNFDSNQMAIDGGYSSGYNASAYGGGKDQGRGTWEVAAQGQTPLLVLRFNDGRVKQFQISYKNKKFYLDGNRYFRTTANSEIADQRPQCW
jgi:hypothetical protein